MWELVLWIAGGAASISPSILLDFFLNSLPSSFLMFGIGLPEFILIMVVALIVVGPDKLPGLARTLGKQVLELKKAANSLKDSLQDELVDEKKQIEDLAGSFDTLNDTLSSSITDTDQTSSSDPYEGINPLPKTDDVPAEEDRTSHSS